MKKYYVLLITLLMFLMIPVLGFASSAYHCSGGLTGGGVGALDKIASPGDNDIAYVHYNGDATYGNAVLMYTFDIDASAGESPPWIVAPDTGSGEWELNGIVGRDQNTLDEDHGEVMSELTDAEVLVNGYVTNQGSAGETDTGLPALSFHIKITFIIEEEQIFELSPPSGELFDLDGTLLDANDCVDSPAVVGSKLIATRMLLADGSTWRWSLDTVRGPWVDGDAED